MQINGVILFFFSAFLAVNAREIFRLAPRAEPAKTREFPYEVSLQKGGYHHCGGALISRTHVLTAAHCVTQAFTDSFDSYAKFLTVEAGTTNIGQGETYEIKRLAYHKDYDGNLNGPRILPNDIAVITLQRPVTESESVKIISLPPAGYEVPTGESVSIAGWGSEVYTSYTSSFLKKSSFKALSFDECYKYGRESMGRIFEPSQICAKFGYGYGTCGGDSGSPLVHNNFVVGIASSVSGEGCGLGHPDIYTKVSRFIPFIKTEMSLQPGTRNHEYAYALNYDENEATQTSYKPTQAPTAPTQAPTTRATQSPPRIDGVHHGFIFEQGKGVIQY